VSLEKCTGGENTEFIECKASTMISSMSTLAENDEKVSEVSSNANAGVCEHEQSPSDDEEIELDWTKEALTFKWYEEPEDWDRLCPADADMDDMKTRYRELYLSFLKKRQRPRTTTGFPVNRRRRSRTKQDV